MFGKRPPPLICVAQAHVRRVTAGCGSLRWCPKMTTECQVDARRARVWGLCSVSKVSRLLPSVVWLPRKHDTVSERLRRWTRNPLGSARRGSNPLGVVLSCRPSAILVALGAFARLGQQREHKASRRFEPQSLDSESRVLTVTPRGRLVAGRPRH